MNPSTHLNVILRVGNKLGVGEEDPGHTQHGLLGPLIIPVDGAAVDEGGELAQSVAEGVTDGAESDHDVQVGTATADEESKQLQWRQLLVLVASLCERSH